MGDPKGYDISISRSGTGFDADYIVQGTPPEPLDRKTKAEFEKNWTMMLTAMKALVER